MCVRASVVLGQSGGVIVVLGVLGVCGGGGGVCDRQRSHLTLHVSNRLKEFFPVSSYPTAA